MVFFAAEQHLHVGRRSGRMLESFPSTFPLLVFSFEAG